MVPGFVHCRAMDALGAFFASLVLVQLIMTAALLSVIAASRVWTDRPSGVNARTAFAHELRRTSSDFLDSLSRELNLPNVFGHPTSPAGQTSNANGPRPLTVPVLSRAGLQVMQLMSDARGFRVRASDEWPERLVGIPPLVSLPVTSLAGLPISRPVLEGWSGRRKRSSRAALRRTVKRVVSARCPACQEFRALGRDYCEACARRLTPFLASAPRRPVGAGRPTGANLDEASPDEGTHSATS